MTTADGGTGLERLARAHGVATSYVDAGGTRHEVGAATVRAVLGALDVRCDSDEEVRAAAEDLDERPWRSVLPGSVVVAGRRPRSVTLHVPEQTRVHVRVEQEDGGVRPLGVSEPDATRALRGRTVTRRTVLLPDDLALGYHRLVATVEGPREEEAAATVIVAPARCPAPGPDLGWGWMLQLYALRSTGSWQVGDLADLRELAARSGRDLGASFVLCNPLHAPTLLEPIEPSPYYPSSRRFFDPLYLRIENLPEFRDANPAVRARVERLGAEARERNRRDRIDRDAAWRAKSEALELLRSVPAGRDRRGAFARFRRDGGEALERYGTFCALAERHGKPWQRWPDRLRHPRHPAVAAAGSELADRVTFHVWLQFCLHEQLLEAQHAARAAGMGVGILHDLAVGVDPGGADAWALQDDLALGVTVGAPPDPFNQRGQDWQQPPLRPDRLARTGYAAVREMLAAPLTHGGGVRIDHVLGLFRLWWIPEGHAPGDGAYVTYPARELLAVLALEASRAQALVVGEDLGTVAPAVRDALTDAGVLGSRVVWFERRQAPSSEAPGQRTLWPDDRPPPRRPASEYQPDTLASVTTHDLPTVAGWWHDEDVRVRVNLGVLAEGVTEDDERRRKARERAELVDLLRDEGLLPRDGEPDADDAARALHRFLGRTASQLVAVQPGDALGDTRQPNLPGTVDEYPNWTLPIAEPTGTGPRPVLLEDFLADERVARLAHDLVEARGLARRRAEGQRVAGAESD